MNKNTLTIIFIIATLFVGIITIYNSQTMQNRSIAHEREMKSIELQIHFQTRWDKVAYDIKGKIYEQKQKDAKLDEILMDSYYNRFWDLQLEQYQVWKKRLLDISVYSTWMDYRWQEFQDKTPVGALTYKEGWENFKESIPYDENEVFVAFVLFIGRSA